MKIVVSFVFCLIAAQVIAQPDIAVFTDNAQFDQMSISPNGQYIAYTQREENVEALTVLNTSDLSVVSNTNFGAEIEIDAFYWANNERILFSPARKVGYGISDFYQRTGEIFGVDVDGQNFEVLFGFLAGGRSAVGRSTGMIQGRRGMQSYAEIIDLLPDDPDFVLVQNKGYDFEGEFNSAWRMNVKTGKLRRVKKSPLRNGSFTTDHNHQIRFVAGGNYDNVQELYYLNDKDDWELVTTDDNMEDWLRPVRAFDDQGNFIVSNTVDGITGYSVWNPETGELNDLFHHATADITAEFSDNSQATWAFRFVDHFPDYFYPNPNHPFTTLHRQLRAAFPNQDVMIIDETDDLSKVVLYVTSPQNPGDFIVFDVANMQYLLHLPRYPIVPKESLSRVDPFEFEARDGLLIRGYLTVPQVETEKDLPTVVMVHGGPFGITDNWSYNPEAQLLASRGYAVLQTNFRGSGGRGFDFIEAGKGQWGAAMQDDITDAVQWAINDGITDPERICIYGGSYGAFSALSGVSKEPDLFKCAIGMSGVYDLNLLKELGDIADAVRGQSYLEEYVGTDESQLSERSPVSHAAAITANVMLIHGKLDDRAPIEHAEAMKEALNDAGQEVEWIIETREDHGIMAEDNRVPTYGRMLQFLEENIGQ